MRSGRVSASPHSLNPQSSILLERDPQSRAEPQIVRDLRPIIQRGRFADIEPADIVLGHESQPDGLGETDVRASTDRSHEVRGVGREADLYFVTHGPGAELHE